MNRALIVAPLRTPFGKARSTGVLHGAHPTDLLGSVLRATVERSGIAPQLVEDVIVGCVQQVGEQSGNIARHAALAAGLPESVPGVTIDRKCGSFQQAVHFAAQGVIAGAYEAVLAGGVEMMSLLPMRTNRLDRDELGPDFRARYPDGLVRQGISAELIAARWQLERTELDAFALRSHQSASEARQAGRLARSIVPVDLPDGRTSAVDEGIRPTTTSQALAALRPAFHEPALQERFPEIGWRITAGNSSPTTDGAAAVLVCSDAFAEEHGLTPRAAVTGFAVVGDDPHLMLMGIVPATDKLLARAGLTVADVDVFEVNEAFASVVLAWLEETGADPDRVNPDGGAIAYGHPVGASGGRLLIGLLDTLERLDGRRGLWTMCESGGMANATLIERLS